MSNLQTSPKNCQYFCIRALFLMASVSFLPVSAQEIEPTPAPFEWTIPAKAVPAKMKAANQPMTVIINGMAEILAPGAQIRDLKRRLILPAQLPFVIAQAEIPVRIERDMQGQLIRIWIAPAK